MAYTGSTAVSTAANPPLMLHRVTGGRITNASTATVGGGGGIWLYSSTNATTDMVAANFFADAYYLGMKQGDLVLGVQASSAGSTTLISFLGAVGAVTTAGAALSTGGTITSTFN